jgi:hypothetical protein
MIETNLKIKHLRFQYYRNIQTKKIERASVAYWNMWSYH